ncbi:MAG: hypothetical protein AAF479_02570 [Pseudomonadota bacterium]
MRRFLFDAASRRARFEMRIVCDAPLITIEAAGVEMAKAISEISGGATIKEIKGIWAADGSLDLDRYQGPFEIAVGIAIEVTVTLDRAGALYAALPEIVSAAARKHTLPARWIHTDIDCSGSVLAGHFEIDPGEKPATAIPNSKGTPHA